MAGPPGVSCRGGKSAMENDMKDAVRAAAIEWHVRLRHGDDAAWEAFDAWLADDASHALAYAEIEDMDYAIEPLLSELQFREAANDVTEDTDAPPARRARWWGMAVGALAASVAAVVVITPQLRDHRYEVATRPGENQIVTLDAGTRVTLNGATRMVFDRYDPRYAALASGEALFQVRHDSARPFRLQVGDRIIEDAGTIFNVVNENGQLRVEVAEGKVVYNPGREATLLDAGQALIARAGSPRTRVIDISVATVGGWQKGMLVYRGEPLSRVAADLSRATGLHIKVSPEILARPVYGTIIVEGSGPNLLQRIGLALQLRFDADGDGWIIKPIRDEEP